jgi:hypothetical protein
MEMRLGVSFGTATGTYAEGGGGGGRDLFAVQPGDAYHLEHDRRAGFLLFTAEQLNTARHDQVDARRAHQSMAPMVRASSPSIARTRLMFCTKSMDPGESEDRPTRTDVRAGSPCWA